MEYVSRANQFAEMELALEEAVKILSESDNLKERLSSYLEAERSHLERSFSASGKDKPKNVNFKKLIEERKVELPWFCDPAKGGYFDNRKSRDS